MDRKGKRIGKKKKTSVKMGNLNPYFNESFVFLVEQEQLRVKSIMNRVSHWANVFFFSALLHRPRKAADYAVPTATAPLCGLLHCVACVARLKRRKH